jgi:aldose 1-epimerase
MMMDQLAAWVSWAAFEGMALFPTVCVSTIALAAPYVALRSENFREQIDGKQVSLFAIRNRKDMEARITNYGARIEQVLVPDHCGQLGDVVQGYESIDEVKNGQASMGAFIGRFANRIA